VFLVVTMAKAMVYRGRDGSIDFAVVYQRARLTSAGLGVLPPGSRRTQNGHFMYILLAMENHRARRTG